MKIDLLNEKNKGYLLHVLRNPHGWSDEVVCEMRLKAANELERLYNLEEVAKHAAQSLSYVTSDTHQSQGT